MKKLVVLSVVATVLFGASVRAEDQTVKLQNVVVTATKTAKDPADVTQSVTVVTAEEIKRSGATDVATAIQNTVSVHIQNYGTPGAVESVNLRGAYASQVLVLLDGMRMNSARDGGFDLSFVPVSVDDIERIEIVRGPSSALYGSDAVGGVINIITKKPSANKSTVSASAGSHGYDDLFLNNSGRDGGWFYSLSGERETSDGYRLNSDSYQWTFGGKAGYDLSKTDSLEVTANYLSRDNGVPGAKEFPSPHARQDERNAVLGANYHAKLGSSVDLNLSGYRKQDDLSFRDPDTTDFMTGLPAPTYDRYQTTSSGEEARLSWLLASWNLLTVGYEWRRDVLDSFDAQLGPADHSASLTAYYVQDEINIGDSFIVDIGGRHDHHSVYGEKFSPKASARYLIKSTDTIIRASYGKSFRAPTFNDLFFDSLFAVGNPNLRPESAKEYEAGIEQKLGKDARVMLTGFDRKVTDLISWNLMVFPIQPENIGRAHIRGYEAEASEKLSDTVFVAANYTYLNPVDEVTGQKIYYTIPQWELKGTVTMALAGDVSLTADWRAVEQYVPQGAPNWRYQVLDAKIAQKYGKDKRSEVFFAMSNILDRQYDSVRTAFASWPAPPREIRGGVTYAF